jgi:hypothetical protein
MGGIAGTERVPEPEDAIFLLADERQFAVRACARAHGNAGRIVVSSAAWPGLVRELRA